MQRDTFHLHISISSTETIIFPIAKAHGIDSHNQEHSNHIIVSEVANTKKGMHKKRKVVSIDKRSAKLQQTVCRTNV